jgi:molybdate transport system substrate-binding protein
MFIPAYQKQTGVKLETAYGPSMGETPEAIPNRLLRGEPADMLIVARGALESLVKPGKVAAGSEVDLVRSRIGMVVKTGAPQPEISSVEGLKRTLLNARSIAYSDSAGGVYFST